MALFSQASDIKTRQTVWVGTNVVKGNSQANSHTRKWDYDGLSAVELSYLHTDYHGNVDPS